MVVFNILMIPFLRYNIDQSPACHDHTLETGVTRFTLKSAGSL